jgi:hypothetical protein
MSCHGYTQLKSLIKYQTTRCNHLPWATAVRTHVYSSRISGRTCGDHKRWTLRHYVHRSMYTMAVRHTSKISITGVPRILCLCYGRAVMQCCGTWRACRQMEDCPSAASLLALNTHKDPSFSKILLIL